jgi:NADPH-dependent 2,4-dienoyl-CoA reductase/sulfur reductase-like enzyme/rhodanese-related sulfurtransferase
MKIVIVGGMAGGATAAARLRRLDETAEIVILERSDFISSASCGFPYYVGGAIARQSSLNVQTPKSFHSRFNVDVRVGHEVTAIASEAHQLTVRDGNGTYEESYDKLLLAPGSRPIVPPLPGLDLPTVFTVRDINDTLRLKSFLEQAPRPLAAVVAGGGFIGLELAENLQAAQCEVSLIEVADHLLPPLDAEMVAIVHNHLRAKGIKLLLNQALKSVTQEGRRLSVGYQPAGARVPAGATSADSISADLVVLALGVRPESELAREAGLKLDERGCIVVDQHLATSDPDIWAVGDAIVVPNFVTGSPAYVPLAGPANKQARVAADNICGIGTVYAGAQGSSVLKAFDLTIASTGLNERQAVAAGLAFDKVYLYMPHHVTYYPGGQNMQAKVLFEQGSGRILGAQLVGGEGVDKRCDIIATAIRFGACGKDLTDLELCYAPPFSAAKDIVNMAGYCIENLVRGKVKQAHWDEVARLPRDGSVTLLDVRTAQEVAEGAVAGFIHIPLDELRQHLDSLERGKPVYIHCKSGLRSYIACRILMAHGFDCYNVAGGYQLWQGMMTACEAGDFPGWLGNPG